MNALKYCTECPITSRYHCVFAAMVGFNLEQGKIWEEKGQYYEGLHAYMSTPWERYEFGSNFEKNFDNSCYKIVD